MYKVINRNGSVFGTEPCSCEFVCDTTDDVSTLPTSITEGTGGKTKYDNQVCGSGSIAVVIDNGVNPKRYILDNQDAWCPQSLDGTGSNQDLSEYAKKSDLDNKADITHTHAASDVGADSKGSAASALSEAKTYTDTAIADLINGAPTTRDTLKEISDLMDENASVVEALDAAIGSKANKTDLSLYALKSKYGDTTIDVGRKAGTDAGMNSTAEGDSTTASGHASHAGGTGTKALHDSEVAYGQYNETNDDTLFSVGDGTSDTTRHNAFEITKTSGKLHDEEIMTQNKITNPNLLINPDFKINQRNMNGWKVLNTSHGTVDTSTQRYIMDRWRLMGGTITITDDGKVWLTGTLIQVLENRIGNNFTASVSVENGTATASYDDSTKTFSIVGDGAVLKWAKLEYGTTATPFVPPDPAVELMKCQRYYQVVDLGQPIYAMGNSTSIIRFGVTLPTAIRATPTVEFLPITGDYTWSITLMKLTERGYIKITDVPTADAVVRMPNYLNIKLTLNTTEIAANLSYMMIGAGGFRLRLDAEIY